jgi:hypothetical protein
VTPFGPGSIADFRVGGYRGAPVSVVMTGLEQWDERATSPGLTHPQRISEARLERKLKVSGFRLPPVQPDEDLDRDVLLGVRFPKWLQCPSCGRLRPDSGGQWQSAPGDARRSCPECSTPRRPAYAVPVRLVTACDHGHLDEFPWSWWAHASTPEHEPQLRLGRGTGSGIGSINVKCEAKDCGRSKTLAGAFGDSALPAGCAGRRPWIGDTQECTKGQRRAVQRGASNLYFAITDSALSIPPWSDSIQQRLGIHWSDIAQQPTADERKQLAKMLHLDEKTGVDMDTLLAKIEARLASLESHPDIRAEEYARFTDAQYATLDESTDFSITPEVLSADLQPSISTVVAVTRLREVRVITGFTRLRPFTGDEEDEPRIAAIAKVRQPWLPAIEIKGEGIFIALLQPTLKMWEATEFALDRANTAASRAGQHNVDPPTPRELLLHTLAHVLMMELSLECGYSLASLRERIYASPTMAGVLIYTGTPDSEGTLGGLVRQASTDRFTRIALNAIRRAAWCSNDPLCVDGHLAMGDTGSVSACYACCLVPETSCERFNHGLDRALLVGEPGGREVGFFSHLAD